MHWHCYRDPYLWVRGVGLCRLRETLRDQATLPAHARRLATFTDYRPHHGAIMHCDTTSRLQLVAGPSAEPLTLSEAKQFLRIEHTEDDVLITRSIGAARQAAEEYLRQVLLAQTFTYETVRQAMVALPVGPAQSVTQVQSIDAAGVATTVAATDYRLTIDGFGLLFQGVQPSGRVSITYVASTAASVAEVPALIKQGMLHHVAVMLEDRAGFVPMPSQSLACYQPYRQVRL